MVKGLIDIVVRSFDEKEVRPGKYDYDYTLYRNIVANCPSDLVYTQNNADSIIPNTSISNDFSFIFMNDQTDRINRILYIRYKGVVYDVSRIVPYPPRVRVSVGNVSKLTLSDLGIEEV